MAGQRRQAQTQVVRILTRSPAPRGRHEGSNPPKKESAAKTVADILSAEIIRWNERGERGYTQAARALIAQTGSHRPSQITPAQVIEAVHAFEDKRYTKATRNHYAGRLKAILEMLWEYHGAPRLMRIIPHYPRAKARNVTVTREQIEAVLNAAPASLLLWLRMCSDMAMRSGTAVKINGENWDEEQGTLTFTTKGGAKQVLPVTDSIAGLLESLDHRSPVPYVWQLRRAELGHCGGPEPVNMDAHPFREQFQKVLTSVGITKRIRPHDLRRTAARTLLKQTKDIRLVQGLLGHNDLATTVAYIEQDLAEISREQLEAIKQPFIAWRKDRTA